MELDYSIKLEDEGKVAKAMGRDFNISFKHAVVICDKLRGMNLQDAITLLDSVTKLERSIPFKRFNKGVGHRKGAGKEKIGKYPEKASDNILTILRNVETNADYKGLDIDKLKIFHIQAQPGIARRRRKPKGSWKIWKSPLVNIQVMVKET